MINETQKKGKGWEYRVIEFPAIGDTSTEKHFQIFSVYYDEKGKLNGISDTPAYPGGATIGELNGDWALIAAATKKPSIPYAEICPKEARAMTKIQEMLKKRTDGIDDGTIKDPSQKCEEAPMSPRTARTIIGALLGGVLLFSRGGAGPASVCGFFLGWIFHEIRHVGKHGPDKACLYTARAVIQEWVDKQGHERCWYYPELFNRLVGVLGITVNVPPQLPSLTEFQAGCKKYQEEQYL